MAAVAPAAMVDDADAKVAGDRVRVVRVLMAAAVAAMEVFDAPCVQPIKPYEYRPNTSATLDALFDGSVTQYQRKCRLTQQETLKLLALMGYPEPRVNDGRFKYSPLHRFIIYLQCMARHKAFEDIAFDVGYAVDSLETNITYWTEIIIAKLHADPNVGLTGWTDAEQNEWKQRPTKAEFPEAIGCVDGFYIQINRPQVKPQLYWSQYKKFHGLLFIIVCDRAGRIRFLSPAVKPGHASETSTFSAQLPFKLIHPLKVLGDGAYTSDERVLYPFAKDELSGTRTLTRSSKLVWNYRLRRQRVLVEWVIGRLRMTWAVLHTRFEMDRGRATAITTACALLLNFMYGERQWWPGVDDNALQEIAAAVPVQDDDHIVDPR